MLLARHPLLSTALPTLQPLPPRRLHGGRHTAAPHPSLLALQPSFRRRCLHCSPPPHAAGAASLLSTALPTLQPLLPRRLRTRLLHYCSPSYVPRCWRCSLPSTLAVYFGSPASTRCWRDVTPFHGTAYTAAAPPATPTQPLVRPPLLALQPSFRRSVTMPYIAALLHMLLARHHSSPYCLHCSFPSA
jgi:hypothetical protein